MIELRRTSPTRTGKILVASAIALSLLLSACGSSKKSALPTSTSNSSTSSTSSSTTSTSLVPTTAAATNSPTSVPATGTMSHLVAVRVSAAGHGDQVAFEFDKGTPGYSVVSTTSPVKSDSGAGVSVTGVAATEIVFSTASDVDLSDGLKTYYNGSKRFTPADAKIVSEIAQVTDNEGRLTWAIGTSSKASVTVTTVASPAQVVVSFN